MQCQDLIMVEDSLHSIQTAKKAGLKVVGVYEEYSADKQEQIREISDIYIENLGQLPKRLMENGR